MAHVAAVIGRAGELEAIERLLGALAGGPAGLVLEGPPAIGKTTLMRAGVEAARRHGARVLSCAPGASETRLPYAALTDLLGAVEQGALQRLPPPQRIALDAALLRCDPGAGIDPRAVATAVLSLLQALAEKRPVIVAIDDLQWLDRPTARVLEFCARRLVGGVGVIASRRVGEESAWTANLTRLSEPDRVEVRALPPFDLHEIGQILDARGKTRLTRHALARVHDGSGGNPFYALELARTIAAEGPPAAVLTLPASLDEIVAARLAELGEDVREPLLAVAALAEPTLELLQQAFGPEVTKLLDDAQQRGVIELDARRLRFTHPLLASGVYARAGSARRRALHRRLSEVVCGVEERARHLAYALLVPDAVAALDDAARQARGRGAPDAAAELLELALQLGAPPALRVRAAEHHLDAGDPRRAQTLLAEALQALPSGETRAEALVLLGEIRYHDNSYDEARALLERALAEPRSCERLGVMIHARLALMLFNMALFADAAAAARSALGGAKQLDDPRLLGQAIAGSVITDFGLGLGVDEQRLARALELEAGDLRTVGELRPSHIASYLYRWTGRLDESRQMLIALAREHAECGEEQQLAWLGHSRVSLECSRGDIASARAAADDSVQRLLRLETPNGRAHALALGALVDAYAGRADECRRAAKEALALFDRGNWQLGSGWQLMVLGFLELSIADYPAAASALEPLARIADPRRLAEPMGGDMFFYGDIAEAFVGTRRIDEAETIVSWLEERGAALDRPFLIAVGARCRGLLLAADRQLTAAEHALERALVAHERLPMPIERARSLLALGRIRRRLRKRLAAKHVLDEALEIFEHAGAALWADQARSEIGRIGLRRGVHGQLTPAEERVATLAAEGLTNREVAVSLNVSPKTVEAHLARVYRKLGIRSRAGLVAHIVRRDLQRTINRSRP